MRVPRSWTRFSVCSPGFQIERSAPALDLRNGLTGRNFRLTEPACEVGEWPHGYLNQHRHNGSLTRLPVSLSPATVG